MTEEEEEETETVGRARIPDLHRCFLGEEDEGRQGGEREKVW